MKKFVLAWTDDVNKCITIEAKDKEDALKQFFRGDFDFTKAEIEDENYQDDSLEIY